MIARRIVAAAHKVSVTRGTQRLLDHVSLELRAGEVLALIGPNGAGKSTLLSLLAGETKPSSGTIEFFDREISAWRLRELAQRRSVLLQDSQLSFSFSVAQVVEMGRAPWRHTARANDDDDVIAWALEATQITHLKNRHVPSLSGGERARVHFARVLAGQTGVLMLDEPTAALDIGHQEALLQLVRSRAAAGDAVLIVLHELALAAAYADRVALLNAGNIAACGTPDHVLTAEQVSSVYRTPVEVIVHPHTGARMIVPIRDAS